jgi:hypothetical protein
MSLDDWDLREVIVFLGKIRSVNMLINADLSRLQ